MPIDESAFLYMEPRAATYGRSQEFAQCVTCRLWAAKQKQCMIHGPKVTATADTTCGLYLNGKPITHPIKTLRVVTPKESGAERREVRCENCHFFMRDRHCALFMTMNNTLGKKLAQFRTKVHPYGCCNANLKK